MIQFDPTISLGHLISAAAFLALIVGGWLRIERLIARLDERTLGHAQRITALEDSRLDPDPYSGYTVYGRRP